MTERATLNLTTGDLDVLARLESAQREIKEIAAELLDSKTSKKAEREHFGRRLNGIGASLRTVTIAVTGDGPETGPYPPDHPRYKRLRSLILDPENAYPEPMIDTRYLRRANGTATADDRAGIARDEATIRAIRGETS